MENGHAKLQFEDHHLTHHKNYLWETPGKWLEKGGPFDRGPAVEPTGSTEPVARGAHDYLQERQVYVQELKSGGAWPINELEGKHDPLHNFGIKIKVGEGNLTRADADLVRDAIMDLQGKYKLASNEYFRAGDANDHVAQDHAATQMVDAFAAAEQLKGILHSGRIGDLANFRDSLSSVVAKPAGGGAGEAAVAVQTGVRGFDSSSLVGRGCGGGEGERFNFGPEKVDPRFNHSGLKSAAEIEKEVAPNESAGAADKELAASQGTAGAKEAAVASPAEVQAKMQADLALVEENMPILRLKFLDVQDAISDRIGEVKSVNQSALDLSRQITSAMDKLLTGNIPGDELYKLAPLVQIDTTHASPSEIFNSVKDLFPSEAQAYFNHSTANIMSESGAVYSVVVADHPSHAITLIDSGGNAFTYIDNNNTFTTDSEGVVVVVAPGGAHFNGVVNYFQGNNFPMVIKGEPVGLVDSMQPEEVALAAKEKAGISSEPVARGNRQGGSRGETARAVAADTSSKGMGAGLERQLEGARTLIETGSFTTAQQRVLENVQFMLHNRETTWSADGSGLRALAEQVPNISTFLNDPQYSGQVDSWLQGLLKEHHSLVDKFVSNLQSGSDFNKIMGPVSAHLLGFEDLPNVHLDTSDPASLSAFRRSELESLRVRFATTLERSLQQAVQDKSIREANSWMGDKSPSNGGQI